MSKAISCEGCGDFGCEAPVRLVVVSRVGELWLCDSAIGRYEDANYVVSEVYCHSYYDADAARPEVDSDILRQLGHYLKD